MVNVIGLGYIGLPTALMLAAHDIKVVGTDYNKNLVEKLRRGELTFDEAGMENIFARAANKGITFSNEYHVADIYIIAVPTPYDKDTKKIDPDYVIRAVENVLTVCNADSVVVIESTIAPGTIESYVRPLVEKHNREKAAEVRIAHAPERIIPGNMLYELENNSRVIGADDEQTQELVKGIYQSFCKGEIVTTDIRTAEMTKVVENTYRDVNIAFANELTKICRSGGMDVYEIIRIANMHPRVNILQPGPGVGGHCISVDPWFLVGDYPGLANIILTARNINDSMPEYVLERISVIMAENNMKDYSRIGLYGLTYKENVDDVRESPTLQLLEMMHRHLAPGLKVYDPYVKEKIADNQYFDFNEFIEEVDLVVIMVNHDEIKKLAESGRLAGKIVLDTRKCVACENRYSI